MTQRTIGAVELGGTKTIVAIGTADGTVFRRASIPTSDPEMVIGAIRDFLASSPQKLEALGVGAFGPVVIDPAATDYGFILETNKPGWSGFDLRGALADATGLPVRMTTDVGTAAMAEARLGALRGIPLGVYMTVGTGIGGAIIRHGDILPALLHPEIGHVTLQRFEDDEAPSTCRYHADCAEGLAAGPAIARRFGVSLSHFSPGGPEYRLIAHYLGQLCATTVLMLSPMRIVLGGGVGQASELVPQIQAAMTDILGPYGQRATAEADFMLPPALGQDAGITGALLLASQALPSVG